MKYQGYTILRNIDGYSIYNQNHRIGWAVSIEKAKNFIDNMFVANFA